MGTEPASDPRRIESFAYIDIWVKSWSRLRTTLLIEVPMFDVESISNAIKRKQLIEIEYTPGLRRIEPHCLGVGAEGQILLRAYQVGGASASGEHEHWKLFRVDRMGSIVPLTDGFQGPSLNYSRRPGLDARNVTAAILLPG
jgi:WYL domain